MDIWKEIGEGLYEAAKWCVEELSKRQAEYDVVEVKLSRQNINEWDEEKLEKINAPK